MTRQKGRITERHYHDWEAGDWGVILGVSRCRSCDKVSEAADFAKTPELPAEARSQGGRTPLGFSPAPQPVARPVPVAGPVPSHNGRAAD